MISVEKVQELMREVGPILEPDLLEQHDSHVYLLAMDDAVVEIEFFDEQQKLTLSSSVGAPNEEQRMDTYGALLAFNSLWADTGGVKAALDGIEGNVLLVFDMHMVETDIEYLCEVIKVFVTVAVHWQSLLDQGGVDLGSLTSDFTKDEFEPSDAIRV